MYRESLLFLIRITLIWLLTPFMGLTAAGIGIVASAAAAESSAIQAHVEFTLPEQAADNGNGRCVVLLHGLARTASSMRKMASALNSAGYTVANVDYPSRHFQIAELSKVVVAAGVAQCRANHARNIYMVAHSLGAILIRDYLHRHEVSEIERVVMLGPPNHGSAVVDKLKHLPSVVWFNGPAFLQLGTGDNSVPRQLGPVTVDTAVIAGTRSINLILSTFLENPDDGKVSVNSARVDGMCALLTLPVSHPFIMKNDMSIAQTLHYLNSGRFSLPHAEYSDCTPSTG
jgi:hypothetical protein